jgi:hypothetical protein
LLRWPQHFDTNPIASEWKYWARRGKMPDRYTRPGIRMRLTISFTRTLFAAALAALALLLPLKPALAAEYTDLWVTPGEDAWGVNFVQWGSTIFATFYIYGPDKKPVWYTAVLGYDGASKFAGTLFSEQGTYFGAPWNPGDMNEQPAGTATFVPSTANNYQGNLTYTVIAGTTVTTVNKSIRRLTVVSVPLAGNYYGGETIAYSGCKNSANNANFTDSFPLTVTQSAGSLTLVFIYEGLGATCTMSGALTQNGLLYSVPAATYTCTDGLSTTAAMSNIKQTALGIEGQFSAPDTNGDGCQEDTRFSAVRN